MNKHLKVHKRYETRDGQTHDCHEAAIRHEYSHAIPNQLAKLVSEKCLAGLSPLVATQVADAILGDAQNVINILSDFLENAEVVSDFDRQRTNRETAERLLAEKGITPLQAVIERKLGEDSHA